MGAPQMSPSKAKMWNARFEQARAEGAEAFFRAWLDMVKISALQKAKRTTDPDAVFNAASLELERLYHDHLT